MSKFHVGQLGNNLMDRWAKCGPKNIVSASAHIFFWPIVFSQFVFSKFGWIKWYSLISPTSAPSGKLFLGALPWPQSLRMKLIEDEKISSVVNLVAEKSCFVPSKWTPYSLAIPLPDFVAPSYEQLEPGVEFIQSELASGRNVYVHCRAGKGRSATLVACWLVKYKGFTPASAQSYLSQQRPQVLTSLASRLAVIESAKKKHFQ